MSPMLVVEEDDATRYAMTKTLDDAGFDVAQVHDF